MWKKKKCAEIFKKLICGRKRNIWTGLYTPGVWLCWVLGLPRCAGAVVGWLGYCIYLVTTCLGCGVLAGNTGDAAHPGP